MEKNLSFKNTEGMSHQNPEWSLIPKSLDIGSPKVKNS
jgi:hypothetical protein